MIGHSRTETPAERVLQDLDVYRTPLLPTRLRSSPGVPDMFRPRKLPLPVLMAGEHSKKMGLGSADKEKDEPGAKPYAGRGGMKKLLARRKQEENEEHHKERESDMETDDVASTAIVQTESEPRDVPILSRLAVPEFPPAPAGGRPSTLRVGRNKTSRSHAPPVQRGKNRFSAADEEGDDSMLTSEDGLVEAPKPPSLFQPPSGFSFAKDVSAEHCFVHRGSYNVSQTAPIKLDSSASKEPPIASLPFSFGNVTPDSSKVTMGAPSVPLAPKLADKLSNFYQSGVANHDLVTAVPTTATTPPVPNIQLIPATPAGQPAKESASPERIPNFFANSSALAKPILEIKLPTGPSLFGAASSTATSQVSSVDSTFAPTTATAAAQVLEQKEAPKQPLFGSSSATSNAKANSSGSPFGTLTGTAASIGEHTKSDASTTSAAAAAPTSVFGTAPSTTTGQPSPAGSLFMLGSPTEPTETSSASASLFGAISSKSTEPATTDATPTSITAFSFAAPTKPSEKSTASAFSFGAPAKADEGSTPSLLGPPANIGKPTNSAPPASVFTFGQPKEQQAKPADAPATEAPKSSLFGASSSAFGGFGSAPSTTSEPAKPSFVFGQQSAATSTPATSAPTIQAPKPLFGGSGSSAFSFGPANQGSTTTAAPSTPAKSPFSFGPSQATPPATSADKPVSAFTFGAGSGSAPTQASIFGGPTSGSQGADVSSKPFTFGAPTPARPTTPPRQDQEISMDESPVRGAGMDMNGHSGAKEPLKLNTTFSFGQPNGPSPFGQPSASSATTPFGFGASSSASSIFGGAKTENKQEAKPSSGFSFGQPSGSGFGFGQKPADAPAPSVSPAPFGGSSGFGQPAAPTTAPFAFSRSTSAGGTGGFGQPPAVPSSPSPSFGASAATSFPFGSTPTSATAPHSFSLLGSRPASPATSTSSLPAAGGSNNAAFHFGQTTAQAPAAAPDPGSPYGGAQALPAGGQAVFNIGAAPRDRVVKKLPTRRTLKR